MRRGWLLIAVLCSACSATTPVIDPTDTPTSSASPSPTETPAPPVPKARWAVVATGSEVVLYDVSADTERVLTTGEGLQQARFVSRNKVSYLQSGGFGAPAAVHLIDVRTGEREELLRVEDGIGAYGLDRDRTRIAYVTAPEDQRPKLRVQSLVGSRPLLDVVTLATVFGRGISADDQRTILFDRRGERFAVVYTFADEPDVSPERSRLQVRSITGDLEFAAEHEDFPTMAIWSPNTRHLYFRSAKGVFRWSVGSTSAARISRTSWLDPWFSPDRDRLAYGVGGHSLDATIEILDVTTGARSSAGEGLARPVFATGNVIWAQPVQPCPGDHECLGAGVPTGVVKVNLVSGKRKPLALRTLAGIDVFYV